MSPLGIVLIVACLIGDMATPLCPGAFRLDPAQSVDGLGSRTDTALPPLMTAPSVPRHEAPQAAWFHSQSLRGVDIAARPPLGRVLPRDALASSYIDLGSPRSSEDG